MVIHVFRMDTLINYTKDVVHEICIDLSLTIGMVDASKSTNLKILEHINYLEANFISLVKQIPSILMLKNNFDYFKFLIVLF